MNTSGQTSEPEEFFGKKASLYERVFIKYLRWGDKIENFFRKSNYLRSNMKILDAGCGTGIVTKTLFKLANEKSFKDIQYYAFDLTENMLNIFKRWVTKNGQGKIELALADVLTTKTLPRHWMNFDLIVVSAMLEYLPKEKVKDALINLKQLLRKDGLIIVFVTKRNFLTYWFAGKWWKGTLYKKSEIQSIFQDVGFSEFRFKKFTFGWSGFILAIEAKN